MLAVAVIPMLGIGGMQLYRAEMPGAMRNTKLTPRIKETAKALWYIYLGLTVICALAYWLAGMTPFDAITHSFSTIAIGGFSTHDASFAFFENDAILYVAIVFMILSGINFALHFRVLSRPSFFRILRGISARIKDRRSKRALFHTSTFADQSSFRQYLRDAELRTYLWVLLIATLTVAVVLVLAFDRYESTSVTIKHGLFQACLLYTSPSPRDRTRSRMPSSA